MAFQYTCVNAGNKIQFTGMNGKYSLKTGEIGTIQDILIWTDDPNNPPRIYLDFENANFGITLNDISPNSTDFRLFHSDEDLQMLKDHLHRFGIDYYKKDS